MAFAMSFLHILHGGIAMNKNGYFEGIILTALSLMLVCVFGFSVWMYDELCEMPENGMLASVAASVRGFIDENEAVAVFLGINEEESDAENDIAAEAAAYIARYNEIYASVK